MCGFLQAMWGGRSLSSLVVAVAVLSVVSALRRGSVDRVVPVRPNGVRWLEMADEFRESEDATDSESVLLQTDTHTDGAGDGAVGTDELSVPSFYSKPAHEIAEAEREYTPENQLDQFTEDIQRQRQAAALERFSQRLDTAVLAKRAAEMTARTAALAKAEANARFDPNHTPSDVTVTPITATAAARKGRAGKGGAGASAGGDDSWLNAMRLSTVKQTNAHVAALEAQHRVRAMEHAALRNRHRHGHRHHHQSMVGVGEDDVEDEKYMATDKAKEQEIEYEPDEESNFWWWDYWAPYIA